MTDKPPRPGGAPAGNDDSAKEIGMAVEQRGGADDAATTGAAIPDDTRSRSSAPSDNAPTVETSDLAVGAELSQAREPGTSGVTRDARNAQIVTGAAVSPVPPPPTAESGGNVPSAGDDGPAATSPANGGGSGPHEPGDASRRGRGRAVAIVVAAVVVVLGAAYGVAFLIVGDSLARGATVAGIDVGGMTPDEAEAALAEQLPATVDQPIHLTTGDGETTFELVPSEAGLTIDLAATVDAVPGASANPLSLISALIGADDTVPVPAVDEAALEAALQEVATQIVTEPVNGAVVFDNGKVVTSEPQAGQALNVAATAERLRTAFFGDDSTTLPIGDIPLVVDEVPPAVTADEVERAVKEFAEPAMSGPVTVVAGEQSVAITPELISQALTMTPDNFGTLKPKLDGAKLTEVAHDVLAEVGQEGKDATITIENGAPVVVPAQTGRGIAPKALSAAVLPALTEQGDARQAAVELSEVDPELTTEGAEKLGVTEVVSEFTTYFPHAEYRNVNIGTAAEKIDNTLLEPGEEFSLNTIVGERTEANGFTAGTIINGGRLEESLGGGVSQVATTTFHAAFLAGLEDVEHWPHSIYFDRYPIGQEATVAWGAKDMRFGNDTPYGVVVDTIFTPSSPGSDGSLTVKIWSTEHYRVETSVSDPYDYTSPRTIYDTSPECQAQSGSQGFSVTSYRKVWAPDGKLVKDEADPWTYNPNHQVICGQNPDSDDD